VSHSIVARFFIMRKKNIFPKEEGTGVKKRGKEGRKEEGGETGGGDEQETAQSDIDLLVVGRHS